LISDGKGNSAVRLKAGLDFGTDVHPGLHHRAILNRAAKDAALLWDGTANLDKRLGIALQTSSWRRSMLRLYQSYGSQKWLPFLFTALMSDALG